jgi:hypothetical protein
MCKDNPDQARSTQWRNAAACPANFFNFDSEVFHGNILNLKTWLVHLSYRL